MKSNFILPLAAAMLLAACAQTKIPQSNEWLPAADAADFSADGRLAVKVEQKGSYANFDWLYQNQVQTINVNTPLGNTVGQLCQDKKGVLAVDGKGRVYQAATAEELSSQLLGFELPVQYLHIWADGKRAAGEPYQVFSDGRLQQMGWTIRRTVGENNQVKVLFLENSKLSVRLVFDEVSRELPPSSQQQCTAREAQ